MGLPDLFTWRTQTATQTTASMPVVADEDLAADVDEPPDHHYKQEKQSKPKPDFHKSTIQPQGDRKVSLLTKALHQPDIENQKPEIHVSTDLTRRRSMMSNGSIASTAELTSDGGLTSPARTNTPSPPFPNPQYTSFAPFSMVGKTPSLATLTSGVEIKHSVSQPPEISVSPKSPLPVEVAAKKRCISFACPGIKPAPVVKQAAATQQPANPVVPSTEAPKRKCMIKFACGNPKPAREPVEAEHTEASKTPSKAAESLRRNTSRSPSVTRKSPRLSHAAIARSQRESSSIKTGLRSPVAVRAKPKYIVADEEALLSEGGRFHEFAAGKVEDDDWIIKANSETMKEKLTINDTLKKENAIRRLGNEAEEEALEEDENEEEDEDNQSGNESDNEDGSDDDENDDDSIDEDASDGNETDNEAGFADSDDESETEGDFAFWTPGRNANSRQSRDLTYRPSAHRTASVSSGEGAPETLRMPEALRMPRRSGMKILRPGTPDLPDSTDFVCGTLDEDRPLEDAYVSCMEQKRFAKHKRCPQDIDPSFPTSDPEDEEDEHDVLQPAKDSEEDVWLHGKFEDSDEERLGRRRSNARQRKSPRLSPRRLHSPPPPRRLHSPPPPAKTRLRSPPPRKLFGHSPKRMRSPPPARTVRSPPASPTGHATTGAISFAPLGSRPGLTHTKSLPRTPNAFCRQYHAARIIAANGNQGDDSNDGHVRGAIDIVKGLEQKRQRRKEKFYSKHVNRKHNKSERKPQPGKGAERMEQLGLLLSGKTGTRDPYMMSA